MMLQASRPRFWLYTAGPFLVGSAAGVSSPQALLTIPFIIGLFYFLVPANIYLYGANDLADKDTDAHNKKKRDKEQLLKRGQERRLFIAVSISALLGAGLALTQNSYVFLATATYLALGYAYSCPPLRLKRWPIIDSASNILYIMPGVAGYALMTQTLPPLWAVFAGGLWSAAMHLYSAIPDIIPDRRAGLTTTAVLLGTRASLALTGLLWAGAALIAAYHAPAIVFVAALVYPALAAFLLIRNYDLARAYWWFPIINAMCGMIIFWVALL